MSPRSIATRFHAGSRRRCSCRCQPAAFPTLLALGGWTSITPSRISNSLGVGRRDRVGYTIWGHSAAPSTASRPHSRWRLRQPEPGVWLWRSPHGSHYLVTDAGTYNLGQGAFARTVWRAASQTESDHANA